MQFKTSFFILLLVVVFQINISQAQNFYNKVDSLLTELEINNMVIGSVSIFKGGKEVFNRNFGQKNLPFETFRKDGQYHIGSITKMVTAVLIFQLIEENKLTLDTKLAEFYPAVPNADKITIKNMLEHSSGLGDYVSKNGKEPWLMQHVTHDEIMQEIIKQGVSFQPNENTEYSNSGYYLLARIIEQISKSDYYRIVNKKIVKPLKLKNLEAFSGKQNNVFKNYRFSDKWQTVEDFDFFNVVGVGDIASTSHDINVFINSLLKGKLISKESLHNMKPDISQKEVFGRGMYIMPFNEFSFYGHAGDTYGTHTTVGYNADLDLSYSIMLNASRFDYNEIYIAVLSSLFGIDYELPKYTIIDLSSKEMEKYLGAYLNSDISMEIKVFVKDNKLYAQATDQDSFVLNCYEDNKFINESGDIKIHFDVSENYFYLLQNGEKYVFTKK